MKKNDMLCCRCKKRTVMKKWETCDFAGLTFELGPDSEHCKCCLALDMKQKFTAYVVPMVLVTKGKISINWYLYAERVYEELEKGRLKFQTGFHDVMLALNIFSFDPRGNWEVFCENTNCCKYFNHSHMVNYNPRYSKDDMPVYFTRKRDVALFATAIANEKRWLLRRVRDEIWDTDLKKKKI